MVLPDETVGLALAVLAGLVVVIAVVTVVLFARLRRLRRSYEAVIRPDSGDDLFDVINAHQEQFDRLRQDLGVVHDNTERLREVLRSAVTRVGVVRYDAFDDMGGALSYSAALLDEDTNGLVFTTINGRSEARTYAKPVAAGESEFNLSPEEIAAIEAAVANAPEVDGGDGPRRRRRRAAAT